MQPTREERETLKALSLEVFGVSSKYQKFLEGVNETVTHEVEEEIPGENGAEPTKRLVRIPTLTANGVKQTHIKRRNIEEVILLLEGFKKQRDDFMAQIKEQQAQEKAKKDLEDLQEQLQKEISGSSTR